MLETSLASCHHIFETLKQETLLALRIKLETTNRI